MKAAGFI